MRLKKCMLAIVLGTMVLSVSVPVHAEKKAFAFTTNGTEKRVSPAKKSDNEQNAYVTTTYHSSAKKVAISVDNGSTYGVTTADWTFTAPASKKMGYLGKATTAYTYYVRYDPMGGVGTTVRGRYNP